MKIVAIGGGEIGRIKSDGTACDIETRSIDQEIIRLTGKTHPKALFIGTATSNHQGYIETFERYYGKELGCHTDILKLAGENVPSKKEIKEKILSSDLIYVGGGQTSFMLEIWEKYKLKPLFKQAMKKGIVLSGLSAGAICWFKYGNSDSKQFTGKKDENGNAIKDYSQPLIKLKGLNFIPLMACPHYFKEEQRRPSLHRMMNKDKGISIALDEWSAIEVIDNKYRIITSKDEANAYRVYKKGKEVVEEVLPKDGKYRSIDELLKK